METSGEHLSSRKSERTWNRRLRDSLTFDSYRCIFLVSNFNQNLFATKMALFNCSFKGYSKKRLRRICSIQRTYDPRSIKYMHQRRFWSFKWLLQNDGPGYRCRMETLSSPSWFVSRKRRFFDHLPSSQR